MLTPKDELLVPPVVPPRKDPDEVKAIFRGLKDKVHLTFCQLMSVEGPKSQGWLEHWESLFHMLVFSGMSFTVSRGYDPIIYHARNGVLKGEPIKGRDQEVLRHIPETTHTVWMDDDTGVDANAMAYMLENIDKDIVGGLVKVRSNNAYNAFTHYNSAVGKWEALTPKRWHELKKVPQKIKGGYVGFGFVMVRKEVYAAVGYPWFRPTYGALGAGDAHKHGLDISGEDAAFCLNAQDAGKEVWFDPRIICPHYKQAVYR